MVNAVRAKPTTVLESLNAGLRTALAADPRVYLLGEDMVDPYGGAFKVTRGLSTDFPGRLIASPVSEAGLVGTAVGMALRGLRPVVEIMFGDFITLAADQLINHAAKLHFMYDRQVEVPLVVRTPMGGRRGYGPTHSQSLEKLFLGVPGLRVLAVHLFDDPGTRLRQAILQGSQPTLFIENKALYTQALPEGGAGPEFQVERLDSTGTISLRVAGAPPPSLSLAAYGHMAELCRQAALRLAYEAEVFVEVVTPVQIAPLAMEPLLESARRTRRLLVAEEGTRALGWGAEVLARAAEVLGPQLIAAGRVAALDLPIPASAKLEAAVLPGVEQIMAGALELEGAGRVKS